MGQVAIVAYRPKAGKVSDLVALIHEHVKILREEHLATDRAPLVLRASDGAILEIFEWVSAAAMEAAHTNPAVGALWGRFEEVCDYQPLAGLDECSQVFATFEAMDG